MRKKRKKTWIGGKATNPICVLGEPDDPHCHRAHLLEAEETEFHDRALMDATDQVNAIFTRLEKLPPDSRPPRTHLALIDTSLEQVSGAQRGADLLLMWAEDADALPDDPSKFVTYHSPAEAIQEMLRLKDESAGDGPSSAEP
jgi:hypothetical protein